jgi:hypothetical protein
MRALGGLTAVLAVLALVAVVSVHRSDEVCAPTLPKHALIERAWAWVSLPWFAASRKRQQLDGWLRNRSEGAIWGVAAGSVRTQNLPRHRAGMVGCLVWQGRRRRAVQLGCLSGKLLSMRRTMRSKSLAYKQAAQCLQCTPSKWTCRTDAVFSQSGWIRCLTLILACRGRYWWRRMRVSSNCMNISSRSRFRLLGKG